MRSVGPNPCCPNLGRALGLAISAASSKFVNQLPLGCSALAKGGGAGEHIEQEEGRLLHKMAGMANTLGLGLFRTGGDCPLTSELLTSHLDCDLWIQFPTQERALGWVRPGWPEERVKEGTSPTRAWWGKDGAQRTWSPSVPTDSSPSTGTELS